MVKHLRFLIPTFALMLVFGAFSGSYAQGELGKILRRMDTYNKDIVTLRADITVGSQNTQLNDEPEIRSGVLIYAKRKGQESLVRIDWKKPRESMAVVDGKYTLYKAVGGKGVAYTGSSREATQNQKSNSALIFLNLSKEKLNAEYAPSYVGAATLSDGTPTIQVKLTPKGAASHKSADIWIDKDGMLRQARIIEKNNDVTTLLLTKFEPNPSLKKADFNIDLPKGTKVERS